VRGKEEKTNNGSETSLWSCRLPAFSLPPAGLRPFSSSPFCNYATISLLSSTPSSIDVKNKKIPDKTINQILGMNNRFKGERD